VTYTGNNIPFHTTNSIPIFMVIH